MNNLPKGRSGIYEAAVRREVKRQSQYAEELWATLLPPDSTRQSKSTDVKGKGGSK